MEQSDTYFKSVKPINGTVADLNRWVVESLSRITNILVCVASKPVLEGETSDVGPKPWCSSSSCKGSRSPQIPP